MLKDDLSNSFLAFNKIVKKEPLNVVLKKLFVDGMRDPRELTQFLNVLSEGIYPQNTQQRVLKLCTCIFKTLNRKNNTRTTRFTS